MVVRLLLCLLFCLASFVGCALMSVAACHNGTNVLPYFEMDLEWMASGGFIRTGSRNDPMIAYYHVCVFLMF